MKKTTKAAVTLLSAAAIFASGVVADDLVSLVQAELHKDLTIIIDGYTQDFRDANGSPVYPIMYNGTTYLPVRAIGNLMGKDVGWDEATQTITLTAPSYSLGGKLLYEDSKIELRYKESYITPSFIGDMVNIAFTVVNKTDDTAELSIKSISFNNISYSGLSSSDTIAPHSSGVVVFSKYINDDSDEKQYSTFDIATFKTISGEFNCEIGDDWLGYNIKVDRIELE